MRNNSSFKANAPAFSLSGILRDLTVSWKLLLDPSVPGLLKLLLPIGAIIYWISPLDIIPGMPLDDIVILLIAARFFVSLAPRDSVNRAYESGRRASPPPNAPSDDESDVVDTTWRVVDE